MQNEAIEMNAYHEAGRVVIAYLNGYSCDAIELPGAGTGTKLNPGNEMEMVQQVLSGKPVLASPETREPIIEVARKLMTIACAGTCAEVFLRNNGNIPGELEMEIPGQDLVQIEKIQAFLEKLNDNHPEDYAMQIIVSVFKKLKDTGTWKAIEILAAKVLESETKTLTRFYIEDTLMMAGMNLRKSNPMAGSGIGLREDKTAKPSTQETNAGGIDLSTVTPLDIMVRDFLKKIKTDWNEGELDAAMKYLHGVYKEYGE